MTEPTQEQPQVTATVSPAAPPKSRWDAIPHHLGRARTSTVILSVLFLGIGALWLNIRPDPDPPPVTPVVPQSVVPPPTTGAPSPEPTDDQAPTTSAEPEPTSTAPTTTAPEGTTPAEAGTRFQTPTSATPPPTPIPSLSATPTG